MLAAKKNAVEAMKSSESLSRAKSFNKEAAAQDSMNPLWHGMATHVANKPVVGNGSVPEVQRLCDHCEEPSGFAQAGVQTKLSLGTVDDPDEKEADDVANLVMLMPRDAVTSGQAGAAPPAPLNQLPASNVQRLCTRCDENLGEVQTKQNSAEGESSSPSVSGAVADTILSPGTGSMMNETVRSHVEPVLGTDLYNVRIHSGAAAQIATQSLNAKAFTHRNNIFLGQGQSDSDVQLIAHESTHVVQQAGGNRAPQVQREDDENNASETHDEFVARVKILAIARLAANIVVLNEWKDYISAMEGFQLQAQLLTSLAMDYASNAALSPSSAGGERFETWAGTESGAERRFEGTRLATDAEYRERASGFMGFLQAQTQGYTTSPSVAQRMQVMTGELSEADLPASEYVPPDPRYAAYQGPIERWESGDSGGCQTCHDVNFAWQQTAELYGDPLPRGDPFPGFRDFGLLLEPRPIPSEVDEQAAAAFSEWVVALESPPAAHAPAEAEVTEQPVTNSNPYLPDVVLPEGLELPEPRSDLCGPLPASDDSDPSRNFNPSLWGPNSHIVYQAIQSIGAVLTPLGPKGYRVIERRSFDELWSSGPGQLEGIRDSIISQISQRQADYGRLQERIRDGQTPYYDLCPIVDELLPSTNLFVQMQVRQEIFENQAIEFLVQALDLVLLALAIIYPPSIMATMPLRAALAVTRFAVGAEQYRRGGDYGLGMGSGIFSAYQESQAEHLQTTGKLNMFASVLDLGMLGYGRWAARQPSGLFEDELLLRGWQRADTPAGTMWHMPGDGRSIWQAGGSFEFVDAGNRTVGYLDDVGGQFLLRGPSPTGPVPSTGPSAAGMGGGTSAIVPYGPTGIVPYGGYSPAMMADPLTSPGLVTPVAPQGGVLLAGGQGVWMRGPLVTPAPQEPFGLLPASGSSGLPEGEWVIANFSPGGSLADVPASSLPYAGNRAWGQSGGEWWLYRPAQAEPAAAVMHQYMGSRGDRAMVLDIPGQTRSLYTEPLVTGSSHGRGYPMTTAEMTDPVTSTRLARSHLDPHARSRPMVTPEGAGMASTRDPLNYVGHDRRYNEWVRRTLEGRLSDSNWKAIQLWETPHLTTGQYPIVTEEIIIELGANGQVVRAWRFPTTEGYWDSFSDINTVLGPRSAGGFQIPVDEIPSTLIGGN